MQISGLNYSAVNGVSGLFFQCEKLCAKLSIEACTQNHKLSKTLESIQVGRRYQCRRCEIGQIHAGETKPTSKVFGRTVCVRCLRPARRLVTLGVCISCHNRAMEVVRGKNARGTKPIHLKPLYNLSIATLIDSTTTTRHFKLTTSLHEVALSFLRKNDNECYFSRPAVSVDQSCMPPVHGQAAGAGQ